MIARRFGLMGLGVGLCFTAGSPNPAAPGPRPVAIAKFLFSPAELSVGVGDTVVWINDDALMHTTSADSGAWSSPELRRGERFTFVAVRSGRFPYHCAAHPVMRATLIVRPDQTPRAQ